MDPNNMNAAGMPNTPNQPVDSAQPVGPQTVEQALAEANMEVASKAGVPMGAPAKKSGKGMIYGMIIFMILAIGGIGFGVWAMMDGNMQKANLEKQISDLRAQNNQLQEQIAEGGDSSDGDSDTTPSVNTEDYIYVGEWGLKIKKPENLDGSAKVDGYDFERGGQTSDSLAIKMWNGSDLNVLQINYPMGSSCSEVSELCMEYNGAYYSFETYRLENNTMYQDDSISEDLINHFINPDNYSAI